MLTTAPRGTKDILPQEIENWRYVEAVMRRICAQYGYKEIRTPVFEHTELFKRGIGDTTDVVEKEMYTFTDRGNRSITLRPENTASAVRAFCEHKLYAEPAPTKLYYISPTFRCEIHRQADKDSSTSSALKCLALTVPHRMQRLSLLQLLYWRKWAWRA